MKAIYQKNLKFFSTIILILIILIAVLFLVLKLNNRTQNNSIALPNVTPKVLTFNRDEVFNVWELKHKGSSIGQINVKYSNKDHIIFSELYVTRNIDGKDIILYKINEGGFFRFGDRDLGFDSKKYGGFLGYRLLLIGNDFLVVQYLGIDSSKFSDPISVYWNPDKNQFQATTEVPKYVLDKVEYKK